MGLPRLCCDSSPPLLADPTNPRVPDFSKLPVCSDILHGTRLAAYKKTGTVSVHVSGLVRLTNNLWSDCNSPWGHLSSSLSEAPTDDAARLDTPKIDRWHNHYIDAVMQNHTKIIRPPRKRVVKTLPARITGIDVKSPNGSMHDMFAEMMWSEFNARYEESKKIATGKAASAKAKGLKKLHALKMPDLDSTDAPMAVRNRRNAASMIDPNAAANPKAKGLWNKLGATVAMAGMLREKALSPKSRFASILKKNPFARSPGDKQFVFETLRSLDAFDKIQDSILKQLCDIINVTEYHEANTVIFSQGDEGREWYVLVDGILNVSIDKKIVNMMQKGAGFGELALIGNGRRGATVLTKSEYTVVIRIDKLDYNRIMKHAHKKDRQEKRVLLRKIPEIEKLDDIEQDSICDGLAFRARKKGTVLVREGDLITEFVMLVKGRISVWKSLDHKGSRVSVHLGTMNPPEYFGEIKVHQQGTDDCSLVELRCETTCEMGVLSAEDAYLKLPKQLESSVYTTLTHDDLVSLHRDYEVRQAWLREKRQYLDAIVREKSGRPDMTMKRHRTPMDMKAYRNLH